MNIEYVLRNQPEYEYLIYTIKTCNDPPLPKIKFKQVLVYNACKRGVGQETKKEHVYQMQISNIFISRLLTKYEYRMYSLSAT